MGSPRYATDLQDEEWAVLEPLLPARGRYGGARRHAVRQVLDAILYLLRTGCQWRLLPQHWPPWQSVYGQYRRWQRQGQWLRLNDELRSRRRLREEREAQPSAGAIDSQTVKTTEVGGACGYDAGKKIKGRKRHIVVDTLGLLLRIVVHPADIQDRDGAKTVFAKLLGRLPRLQLIWADGGYRGQLEEWVKEHCSWALEIVNQLPDQIGFQVLKRRWVGERTFAWLGRSRRLSKDDEHLPENSESMAYLAMIRSCCGAWRSRLDDQNTL